MGIFWKNKTTRVFIDVTGESESFYSPISSNELANNPNGYIFKIKSSDGIEFISNYSFKENEGNIEVTMYGSSSNYKLVNKTITVENGGSGGGGVTIVNVTENDGFYTFDKSWNDVKSAFKNGGVVVHLPDASSSTDIYNIVTKIEVSNETYSVYVAEFGKFTCNSADAFPELYLD